MEKTLEIPGVIAPESTFLIPIVDAADEGRIDRIIAKKFPYYSRSFFQALIQTNSILLNNEPVNKPSIRVKTGDTISITFPAEENRHIVTSQIDELGIEVLFEHPHFFVIYKPAGIMMHPTQTNNMHATVTDWLLTHYQELAAIGAVDRPGIVHRLDKDTSGIVIIPRTNYAHGIFGTMFKNRMIEKTYHAITKGNPPQEGTISYAIGRHPVHRKKMTAYPPSTFTSTNLKQNHAAPVRSALTHFTVKEQFDNAALVEVKPVTGRTHQIRVHLTALGHSLLGDQLYGSSSPFIDRQALHASSIRFEFEGKQYYVEKEFPKDFENALALLRSKKESDH